MEAATPAKRRLTAQVSAAALFDRIEEVLQ
jgi:hypothetical protein